VKPQLAAEPGSKANFIAAARRAAQAAAFDTVMGVQRADEEKAPRAMLGAIGSAISKHRRPLLIGICAFLIVVGAINLVVSLLGSSDHGRVEPPRPTPNEPPAPSRDDAKPVNPVPAPSNSNTPPAKKSPGRQSGLMPANDFMGSVQSSYCHLSFC